MRIPSILAAALLGSSIVSTCSAQYYRYDYDSNSNSRRCSNAEQSRCCEMTLGRFVGARDFCINNGCNQNICSRKPSSGNNYNNNAWWGSVGVAQPSYSYPATSPYSSPTPPAPMYAESCCFTNQGTCPEEFPKVNEVLHLLVCCYTYQASYGGGSGYQAPSQYGGGGYKYQAQTPRYGYSGGYGYGNRKLQYGAYSQSSYFYGAGSQGYNGGYVSSSRGYDYGKSYDLPQCPNVSKPTPAPTQVPTPAPTPIVVGVYSQPGINGVSNPDWKCNVETDNVVSIIKHFATTDDDFESFESDTEVITSIKSFADNDALENKLAGFKAFVIPDIQGSNVDGVGTDALDGWNDNDDAKVILREYVEDGGVLLVTGWGVFGGIKMLNEAFAWDLGIVIGSCSDPKNVDNTAGTPWENGPDPLRCPSGGNNNINCGSVDCTVMYGNNPNDASVVVIDVGDEGGKVIHLSWNFWNSGYKVGDEFHEDCVSRENVWVTQIFRGALLYAADIE